VHYDAKPDADHLPAEQLYADAAARYETPIQPEKDIARFGPHLRRAEKLSRVSVARPAGTLNGSNNITVRRRSLHCAQ